MRSGRQAHNHGTRFASFPATMYRASVEKDSRALSDHMEPLCCPPAAIPSGIPRGAMLAHRASGITQRMAAGGQPEGTRRFRPGAASQPSTVAPLRSSDRSCPRTEIATSERFHMVGKGSRHRAGPNRCCKLRRRPVGRVNRQARHRSQPTGCHLPCRRGASATRQVVCC